MRVRYIYSLALMLIMAATQSHAYNALEPKKETIFIVGSEHCPYNCRNKNKSNSLIQPYHTVDPYRDNKVDGEGYVVDIVREIFEPLGHKVRNRIMPQKRARKKVISGRYEILITRLEENGSDFIFPKNPIGAEKKMFYTRVDSTWKYAGIPSLNQITLGIIEGDEYPELAEYIEKNKNSNMRVQSASSDEAIDVNIRKLAKNRIDTIYESKYVVDYHRAIMGLRGKIIPAGEIEEGNKDTDLYLGFSAANENSKEYSQQFDEGIVRLRESGELKKILDRYGVEDWASK